jgi:superfamily II DNA/RNA helicase
MPTKIQQLAKTILHDPVEVKLAVSKTAEKIIQAAYICYEAQKLGIIQSLFQSQQPELSAGDIVRNMCTPTP